MDFPRLSAKEAEVLRLLIANGEMYGLELVRSSTALKRGTIYVTLSRMAEKGYVDSKVVEVPSTDGPPRRSYHVTGFGLRSYRAMEAAARSFAREIGWAT